MALWYMQCSYSFFFRMSRLRQLRAEQVRTSPRFDGDYAELERVREELLHARRLFARHGWPVIDVTRRSIEETAAGIMRLLAERHGNAQGDEVGLKPI